MSARGALASLALLAGLVTAGAPLAAPMPELPREAAFLLHFVETSGCRFFRNGTWYDSQHAVAHLRTKFEYLMARHLVDNTDQLIEKGGTSSSLSGQPYAVQCGEAPVVASAAWLRAALIRYRTEPHDAAAQAQ